jgi:transposase
MTVLTVNNLPAATHGETVRYLFAIELSRMSWVIAFNTPLSEKISRRTFVRHRLRTAPCGTTPVSR